MSTKPPTFEETLKELLREVIREELQALERDDKLLTAEQAAEILGYTNAQSIYSLRREGKLEAVYLGEKTMRFRNSDVQRLIRGK